MKAPAASWRKVLESTRQAGFSVLKGAGVTVPTMDDTPPMLDLDDSRAADPALVGAKAANLARSRLADLSALPGVVLTTGWSPDDTSAARAAWRRVSHDGSVPVIVRSSSTAEDTVGSSMAGVFESVADVTDEASFLAAATAVLRSADAAATSGMAGGGMALLVQPMLSPRWGGVLLTADPITGRRDRYLVASVAGRPASLVNGEREGWTALLDRRGGVREVRSGVDSPEDRLPKNALQELARLARAASTLFGGPQDVEWAVTAEGNVVLLQSRPMTALPERSGPVYGPGPVAESFPEPLSSLEEDMWLGPLDTGLVEALRLAGVPARELASAPTVVAVDGMAAVNLTQLGVEPPPVGLLRRLDPRPAARRLAASWRLGRLRATLPHLAADVLGRLDGHLREVPQLGQLTTRELTSVLEGCSRALVSLHGYEALAGILMPADERSSPLSAASAALDALVEARRDGVAVDELVSRSPIVLALVPPRIGEPVDGSALLAVEPLGNRLRTPNGRVLDIGLAREALRLRIRWVQELGARAAWELAIRLERVGALPSRESVRRLRLEELVAMGLGADAPADIHGRIEPSGRPLPPRFRLAADGRPVGVPHRVPRRSRATAPSRRAAGGGVGSGPALVYRPGDEVAPGTVLVVHHLDPRLAPVVPKLAGLVAETGSPLSHLAILAREYGVATVVGFDGATDLFHDGEVLTVDGAAGVVTPVRALAGAGR